MDCNGHAADICENSPPERRSSSRIQKLKREKALRPSPKKEEEVVNKKRAVKVYKRRKLGESVNNKAGKVVDDKVVANGGVSMPAPEVVVPENGAKKDENEVMVAENGVGGVLNEGGEAVGGGVSEMALVGGDKSAYARVTETLRIFNKHYLYFVQVSSL